MQIAFGVFTSDNFHLSFNSVRDWSWESYWIIGGLLSW
jgi:L-rhamnose-H+ transport protein